MPSHNKLVSKKICVTLCTRTMHLLQGVGASAKMPELWHFVCINSYNSHEKNCKLMQNWHECGL